MKPFITIMLLSAAWMGCASQQTTRTEQALPTLQQTQPEAPPQGDPTQSFGVQVGYLQGRNPMVMQQTGPVSETDFRATILDSVKFTSEQIESCRRSLMVRRTPPTMELVERGTDDRGRATWSARVDGRRDVVFVWSGGAWRASSLWCD